MNIWNWKDITKNYYVIFRNDPRIWYRLWTAVRSRWVPLRVNIVTGHNWAVNHQQHLPNCPYSPNHSDSFDGLSKTHFKWGCLNDWKGYYPCHARDWKLFFDPTALKTGAFPGFGVHVLLGQKSLKKLNGAHFEPQVQRPYRHGIMAGVPPFLILIEC